MNTVKNKNYVNLCHGTSNSRVYYDKGRLYSFTVTRENIISQDYKTVKKMSEHIEMMIGDDTCNLLFGYEEGSISKKRVKKLNRMLREEEQDVSKFISLLI